MPKAFLFINTEEFEPQLMKELRKIKGVEVAYPLYGVYDVIVKTRTETMDDIRQIHDKIRKLRKVRQTLTLITHEE